MYQGNNRSRSRKISGEMMAMTVDGNGRRTMTIDATQSEPFEIGAQITALLAFPAADEDARRLRIEGAMCSEMIAKGCAEDPAGARAIRERYRRYAKRTQRASLTSLDGRLKKAMFAGWMTLGFIEEGVTGKPLRLPPGMPSMSVSNLARRVSRQVGLEDDVTCENYEDAIKAFEKRVWRRWHPVLHLASAYQVVARIHAGQDDGLRYDVQNDVFHEAVINLAQFHGRIIRAHPRLKKLAEVLVDFEWISRPVPISVPSQTA